jgi:hypothetical protein
LTQAVAQAVRGWVLPAKTEGGRGAGDREVTAAEGLQKLRIFLLKFKNATPIIAAWNMNFYALRLATTPQLACLREKRSGGPSLLVRLLVALAKTDMCK